MRATRALLRAPGRRAWQQTSFRLGSVGLTTRAGSRAAFTSRSAKGAVVMIGFSNATLVVVAAERSVDQHQVDALPARRPGSGRTIERHSPWRLLHVTVRMTAGSAFAGERMDGVSYRRAA